jgi:aspartate 1-decarboxylase
MKRILLRSKIHNLRVTECNKDYEGSLTLDEDLMNQAGMVPFEQVHIYNISNGERFTTYLIKGTRGSGTVGVNGAAVHKARIGDRLIVASFGSMDEEEVDFFMPKIVIVDDMNRIKRID